MRLLSLVFVSLLCLEACGIRAAADAAKVTLTVPEQSAPASQRIETYENLRPIQRTDVYLVNQQGVKTYQTVGSILLKNGTSINMPDYLSGAVLPDSVTAKATKKSTYYRRKALRKMLGGFGVILLSVPVLATGFNASGSIENKELGEKLIVVGSSMAAVAGAVTISGIIAVKRSNKARDFAYATYEASLLQRLNLCIVGEQVMDCNAPSSMPLSAPTSLP